MVDERQLKGIVCWIGHTPESLMDTDVALMGERATSGMTADHRQGDDCERGRGKKCSTGEEEDKAAV